MRSVFWFLFGFLSMFILINIWQTNLFLPNPQRHLPSLPIIFNTELNEETLKPETTYKSENREENLEDIPESHPTPSTIQSSISKSQIPTQFLVLGMHHSGTSIYTKLLMMMGLWGGKDDELLLEPVQKNSPQKYWERKDVVNLNKWIIERGIVVKKKPYWAGFSFSTQNIGEESKYEFIDQAKNIVDGLNQHRPWVTKDPRMCLTSSLWDPILDNTCCIIVHRNPIELQRRLSRFVSEFNKKDWINLWENYTLSSLEYCKDKISIFLSHSQLADSPFDTIDNIYHILVDKLSLNTISERIRKPSRQEIIDYLHLNDSHYSREIISESEMSSLTQTQRELTNILSSLPSLIIPSPQLLYSQRLASKKSQQNQYQQQQQSQQQSQKQSQQQQQSLNANIPSTQENLNDRSTKPKNRMRSIQRIDYFEEFRRDVPNNKLIQYYNNQTNVEIISKLLPKVRTDEETPIYDFYFIFTTSENDSVRLMGRYLEELGGKKEVSGEFNMRHQRSIESVFYHHPDSRVFVYSNTLNSNIFDQFKSSGYSIEIVRYELEELFSDTPAAEWVLKIESWKKFPYFYSHLTDLMRFVILWKFGGIYLDTDVILVKPFPREIDNSLGFVKPRRVNGAVMVFTEKENPFLYSCIQDFVLNYNPKIWESNGPNLITRILDLDNSEEKYPTEYMFKRWVQLLHVSAFYPIGRLDEQGERIMCWKGDEKYKKGKLKEILLESYAVHMNSKITGGASQKENSLCSYLLNLYCIFCDKEVFE